MVCFQLGNCHIFPKFVNKFRSSNSLLISYILLVFVCIEGVYPPVYSEYTEGSQSLCMLMCVRGEMSAHFVWEDYPEEDTKSFCFDTIRLDALL